MIFHPHCAICHDLAYARPDGTSLCVPCAIALADTAVPEAALDRVYGGPAALRGQSLFRYRGPIRHLVRRAKAQEDHRALAVLVRLFLERREARDAALASDAVVPCPSSLWSRSRGRLDVAWRLAEALAAETKLPLLPAPWHLHWRIVKHARLSGAARRLPALDYVWREPFAVRAKARFEAQCQIEGSPRRLLVVDDVVTTGTTLVGVAAAVAGPDRSVRCLTLAVAGRGLDRD